MHLSAKINARPLKRDGIEHDCHMCAVSSAALLCFVCVFLSSSVLLKKPSVFRVEESVLLPGAMLVMVMPCKLFCMSLGVKQLSHLKRLSGMFKSSCLTFGQMSLLADALQTGFLLTKVTSPNLLRSRAIMSILSGQPTGNHQVQKSLACTHQSSLLSRSPHATFFHSEFCISRDS